MNYFDMDKEALIELRSELQREYDFIKKKGIRLDMSRGKPSREQVEISMPMLNYNGVDAYITKNGEDCCNYGFFDGIKEMKELFASILDVEAENIFVGGNSSLNMMFDTISGYMTNGVCGGQPWAKQQKIKFLCPSPGYDRHFAILEYFKIEPLK